MATTFICSINLILSIERLSRHAYIVGQNYDGVIFNADLFGSPGTIKGLRSEEGTIRYIHYYVASRDFFFQTPANSTYSFKEMSDAMLRREMCASIQCYD